MDRGATAKQAKEGCHASLKKDRTQHTHKKSLTSN
jgi:hypothetical protein